MTFHREDQIAGGERPCAEKDILRLRFESGLGQIARSSSISVGTVHDYLLRAEAAGIKWPLPDGLAVFL